jgi:nucleoid-associated protein YgaU
MYKTKKESRPAATESAKIMNEVFRTSSKKNYITRFFKKQVVLTILFFIVLASTILFAFDSGTESFVPVEHKVTYGDTLWSIAKQYKPDNITMDKYMAWVYEHNDGGMIHPGDIVIMAEVAK